MALRQAKQAFGHLTRPTTVPDKGTLVRLVCDYQPRGSLAKVNGLRGEVTGKRGRWIDVAMTIEGARYTYKSTLNNLRLEGTQEKVTGGGTEKEGRE